MANKDKVFAHYGRKCQCCGSYDHPNIDHIDGKGKAHREELKRTGITFYRWLVDNNFPEGFQTLCRYCNISKSDTLFCLAHHRDERLDWERVNRPWRYTAFTTESDPLDPETRCYQCKRNMWRLWDLGTPGMGWVNIDGEGIRLCRPCAAIAKQEGRTSKW